MLLASLISWVITFHEIVCFRLRQHLKFQVSFIIPTSPCRPHLLQFVDLMAPLSVFLGDKLAHFASSLYRHAEISISNLTWPLCFPEMAVGIVLQGSCTLSACYSLYCLASHRKNSSWMLLKASLLAMTVATVSQSPRKLLARCFSDIKFQLGCSKSILTLLKFSIQSEMLIRRTAG